jgi:hypothetical protein
MENAEQHMLTVESCKKVTMSQITSVDAFSSNQLVLSFVGGRIIVTGSNLKIINFSKTTGAFSASGTVTQIKYAAKGEGLRHRLFK